MEPVDSHRLSRAALNILTLGALVALLASAMRAIRTWPRVGVAKATIGALSAVALLLALRAWRRERRASAFERRTAF